VSVAGGVDDEVALSAAAAAGAVRTAVAQHVERLTWPDGHQVLVLAGGNGVNTSAAEGNPVEIMDLSFAVQLGALRMLLERGDELPRAVVPVDPAVDEATARVALAAWGSRVAPPVRIAEQPADREPDVRTHRFGTPR
jgi:adenosylhomocysteinase